MIYLDSFLYYAFFASAVLFYGIGINRIGEYGVVGFPRFLFIFKSLGSIFASLSLCWLITDKILVPLNIQEVLPLLVFLILIVFSSFFECLVRLTTNKVSTEFIISYLVILLSIMESVSYLHALVICTGILCSIGIICPFIISLRHRLCNNGLTINEKFYSIAFVLLGVILLILSVFDISWLNIGVIE